jgi:hypothetical protein
MEPIGFFLKIPAITEKPAQVAGRVIVFNQW